MGQQRVVGRVLGSVVVAVAVAMAGLGPASAAPTSGPAPVRRLAAVAEHRAGAEHRRTGTRQALRVAGVPVTEADDYYLGIDPGCVKGNGKAKPNAGVFAPARLTLDYTLTGTGDLRKTGTVKVRKNRRTAIALPKVRTGRYRLVLAEHGTTRTVADEAFDVYACVGVRTSCHALTFTNPAQNPAALVTYGSKRSGDFDVELAAGASRTVRVDERKVAVDAGTAEDDDGYVDLGSATVKVKQSCKHGPAQPDSNAVQTIAVAGCAGATRATVSLFWSAQSSLKNRRWEILDPQQQVVAHGSYRSGGRGTAARLAAGTYAYRSYANRLARPFEDVSFTVLGCITVTARCKALDVTNPNATPVHLTLFSLDDAEAADPEDSDLQTDVAAAATTTVPWSSPTASYLALGSEIDARTRFLSLASEWFSGDDDLAEITVPQDC